MRPHFFALFIGFFGLTALIEAAPFSNHLEIDRIRPCPFSEYGRPVGGASTDTVPRECLTAEAVTPPEGTRNVTDNPDPVGADFVINPNYNTKSDFDTQSFMLAAHQEDIEVRSAAAHRAH